MIPQERAAPDPAALATPAAAGQNYFAGGRIEDYPEMPAICAGDRIDVECTRKRHVVGQNGIVPDPPRPTTIGQAQ